MSFMTWRAFGVDGLLVFEARAGESHGVREIMRFVLFPLEVVKGWDLHELTGCKKNPVAIPFPHRQFLQTVMTLYSCDFPIWIHVQLCLSHRRGLLLRRSTSIDTSFSSQDIATCKSKRNRFRVALSLGRFGQKYCHEVVIALTSTADCELIILILYWFWPGFEPLAFGGQKNHSRRVIGYEFISKSFRHSESSMEAKNKT